MEARFFLYINDIEYSIDEPIGIDDFSDKLVRDPSAHGVAFNYSESELKFTDVAYSLLKNEYDLNGVSAIIFFKAEIKCKDSDDWAEFYYGQLDMTTYDDVIDNYNYIALNPAQQGVELTIKNRQEQEVDLHSLVGFDGQLLSSYPMLNKDITLQGQNVLLTSRGEGIEDDAPMLCEDEMGTGNMHQITACEIEHNIVDNISYLLISTKNEIFSEITTVNNYGFVSRKSLDNVFDNDSIFKFLSPEDILLTNPVIDLNIEIDITAYNIGYERYNTRSMMFSNARIRYEIEGGYNEIPLTLVQSGVILASCEGSATHANLQISQYIDTLTASVIENSRFAIIIDVLSEKMFDFADNVTTQFDCLQSKDSYFQVTAMSYFADTISKASFIHETASRIIESITNGKLAVKSDTFKRTDSNVKHQLTNVSLAGTPTVNSGNTALMNGYQIRKSTLSNGLPSYLSMSLKTLMESLTAIYNLGFGVEYDSVNGDVLRLEGWAYFYKSDVIFEINDAPKKRSVNNDELYGTFEGGYSTWETEEFNGQDAFLTGRKYRTDTNITDKTLSKTCKFIADGYAIEATRRKQIDKSTKDYKYDEKQFIVRLVNNGGVYESEKGMTSGDNLIEATSVYNSSISPARNMMRWADRFLQIIPVGKSKVVKFLSGTGNYFAKGISTNSIITSGKLIAENQDITSSDYAAGSIIPLLKPELITLEYPVSLEEWKNIKENPLGVILVDGEKTYIKEVKYNFTKGKANFSLIPKYIQ